MLKVEGIWKLASAHLREQMPPDYYERWIAVIVPVRLESDTVVLGVTSDYFSEWLVENYNDAIEEAIEKTTGLKLKITFEKVSSSIIQAPAEEKSNADNAVAISLNMTQKSQPVDPEWQKMVMASLDRRFTFDTFVEGDNNRFAYTACRSVADAPGERFNPLFIHSSTGLGKTHLLQGIAHAILQKNPSSKILYVTSEQFLNEYIDAIAKKSFTELRQKYRELDVLLIDDVQFIGSKEGFQEEIFHTFNALNNAHKQIVMTSDKPPHEIGGLEKRLVSRFEWGLTTEIQQPDLETRIAIIHKKQEEQEYKLDEEVIRYVAARLKSNVRRLESGVFKLVSWASLSGVKIDKNVAEKVLGDVISEEAGSIISIEEIQRIVAEYYDIRMADMKSNKRPANIAIPRMVAMFLARKFTESSLQAVADKFEKKHATVLHAVSTIEKKINDNDEFKHEIGQIEKKLKSL